MKSYHHGSRKKSIIFATVYTLSLPQLTYLKVSNKWHLNWIYWIILELQRIVWSFSVPLVRRLVNSCFFVSNAIQSNQFMHFFGHKFFMFQLEGILNFHKPLRTTTNVNNENAVTIYEYQWMFLSGGVDVRRKKCGGEDEEIRFRTEKFKFWRKKNRLFFRNKIQFINWDLFNVELERISSSPPP